MRFQQYIPFIFLGLVLLGGVFKWLMQTLREQAAQKRVREREERARLEALRTGRPIGQGPPPVTPVGVDPAASSAQRRLQELAERRRRQLEELKARQAASQPSVRTAPRSSEPSKVSRTIPATAIPQAKVRATDETRAADQKRLDATRRLDRQRAEGVRRQDAERLATVQEENAKRIAEEHARDRTRLEAARKANEIAAAAAPASRQAVAVASGPRSQGGGFIKLDAKELRRAVILQELMGPPVSARELPPGGSR